jgi:hypothetical protein
MAAYHNSYSDCSFLVTVFVGATENYKSLLCRTAPSEQDLTNAKAVVVEVGSATSPATGHWGGGSPAFSATFSVPPGWWYSITVTCDSKEKIQPSSNASICYVSWPFHIKPPVSFEDPPLHPDFTTI